MAFSTSKVAEIQFAKKRIKIGQATLNVEIADTPEKSERGLMNRKKESLLENQGMLFEFPDSTLRRFWMKNTFIPLALGFFDENKTLTEIHELPAVMSEMDLHPPECQSTYPAKYVLEVNAGWFKRNKIKIRRDQFEYLP